MFFIIYVSNLIYNLTKYLNLFYLKGGTILLIIYDHTHVDTNFYYVGSFRI